mgnify:CR=1 FL=1
MVSTSGFAFLHSGYPGHAKNFPYLPYLITIILPHLSHGISETHESIPKVMLYKQVANPKGIDSRNRVQRILIKIPSPLQPNRILSDIPPLQRIVVPVPVVVQPRLLIILLPRQPDKLLQLMRVLFIQQVAPLIVFCAPFYCPFRADKH